MEAGGHRGVVGVEETNDHIDRRRCRAALRQEIGDVAFARPRSEPGRGRLAAWFADGEVRREGHDASLRPARRRGDGAEGAHRRAVENDVLGLNGGYRLGDGRVDVGGETAIPAIVGLVEEQAMVARGGEQPLEAELAVGYAHLAEHHDEDA